MSTTKAWYIRCLPENEVKGPFPAGQISQEILLGRYKPTDEVSHNKEIWLKIENVAELLPDIFTKDRENPDFEDRLAAARRWADERKRSGTVNRNNKKNSLLTTIMQVGAVLTVVFFVIVLAFKYSPKSKITADCSAPAQKEVNWNECNFIAAQLMRVNLDKANLMNTNLQQANLLGANLSFANLKYAKLNSANLQSVNFTKATLKGANLVAADLTDAIFSETDLSYANFQGALIHNTHFDGALLSNAIWVDGRTCAKGSIGQCR